MDSKHPDLRGKALNGYDFFNDDKLSADDNGHGTHVAGIIIAKQNYNYKTDESTAGVSNGKVLGVKVLGAQGYGTSYSLAAGIIYAAKNKLRQSHQPQPDQPQLKVETSNIDALQYAINTLGTSWWWLPPVTIPPANPCTPPHGPMLIQIDLRTLLPLHLSLVTIQHLSRPDLRSCRPGTLELDDLTLWVDRNDDGIIDATIDRLTNERFSNPNSAPPDILTGAGFGVDNGYKLWLLGQQCGRSRRRRLLHHSGQQSLLSQLLQRGRSQVTII